MILGGVFITVNISIDIVSAQVFSTEILPIEIISAENISVELVSVENKHKLRHTGSREGINVPVFVPKFESYYSRERFAVPVFVLGAGRA